jgi:hypothetical protein
MVTGIWIGFEDQVETTTQLGGVREQCGGLGLREKAASCRCCKRPVASQRVCNRRRTASFRGRQRKLGGIRARR